MEKLPILFRKDREGGDIVAFFPTLPSNPDRMVCYAHVGQHGEASMEYYYYRTKPAKPDEYTELLAELTQIYDDCDLVVYKRIPRQR